MDVVPIIRWVVRFLLRGCQCSLTYLRSTVGRSSSRAGHCIEAKGQVQCENNITNSVQHKFCPQSYPICTCYFQRKRWSAIRFETHPSVPHYYYVSHTHNIDVLNRYPLHGTNPSHDDAEDSLLIPDRSTIHVMMYMFPRQFNLHNVFTSHVDSRQTVQPFKDYTLREDEITKKYPVSAKAPKVPKIPKRLRGKLVQLVQKLQIRHRRCPYKKILEYYCPVRFSSLQKLLRWPFRSSSKPDSPFLNHPKHKNLRRNSKLSIP